MQRPIEAATWIGAGFAHVGEVLANDPGGVFGDGAMVHQHASTRTVLGVDLSGPVPACTRKCWCTSTSPKPPKPGWCCRGLAGHGQAAIVPNLHRGAGSVRGRRRHTATAARDLHRAARCDRAGRQRCRWLAARLPLVECTAGLDRAATRGRGGSAPPLGARSRRAAVGTLRDLHRLNGLARRRRAISPMTNHRSLQSTVPAAAAVCFTDGCQQGADTGSDDRGVVVGPVLN